MTWDSTWETVFSSRPWGKYPGEDLVRFIARNFYKAEPRADVKILEVGCGTGANLWFMAREGFTVYGIDGSPTAVEKAKQRLDAEVSNWCGEIKVSDICLLPYPSNFFDSVIDIEAISCNDFEAANQIYAEIQRVLKPGGRIYSRCFSKGTYGDETGVVLGHNTFIPAVGSMSTLGVTRFTSEEDIQRLIADKFTILELDQITRGALLGNKTIEWCITAEKSHD